MNQLTSLREQLQLVDSRFNFTTSHELDVQLDKFFGIQHQLDHQAPDEFYPDLTQEALSTSYLDYFQILKSLPRESILVDLGAGYCRGTLLSCMLKLAPCLSIEAHPQRVIQARCALKKLGHDLSLVKEERIEQSSLDAYQYFYIYFPLNKSLLKTLKNILNAKREVELFITEAHGDSLPFFNSLNETQLLATYDSSDQRHHSKIHHYLFSPVSSLVTVNDQLCSWFLLNFEKDLVIEYEYFHQLKRKQVKLYIHMHDLFPIFYQNQWCLENIYTGRIYSHKEFELIQVLEINELEYSIQELIKNPLSKHKKILSTPQIELE